MTTELYKLPLKPKDRELAEHISRGWVDADNVRWCEGCQELHLYVKWQGRRVMLGSCGAKSTRAATRT